MFNERGHVYMSDEEEGLQSRLVVGSKRGGRRKYDEEAKRELIQACLRPGVSIARTAMDHGINPNLVRTWISQYQREQGRAGLAGIAHELASQAPGEVPAAASLDEPAFMQVVPSTATPAPVKAATRFLLNVRLPNGVCLELGQTGIEELATIVQMLGRVPCSGSTTD
ncbi:transposase [Paraburkholderia sp. GAS41]|jgi:transposase-like protein|uniref:IS66-like element accessory protein TnpA n=1 Tax=Paraburkholderia sp. GAS41 TaxID=3035134 RepID=UPI003D2003B2